MIFPIYIISLFSIMAQAIGYIPTKDVNSIPEVSKYSVYYFSYILNDLKKIDDCAGVRIEVQDLKEKKRVETNKDLQFFGRAACAVTSAYCSKCVPIVAEIKK